MLGGYLKMWISFDREHCEMDGAPKVYPRAIDMTRRELLTHTAESCSSQTKRQRANAILIRGWMSSTHPEAPVIFSRPASIPGSASNSSNLSWEIFRQNLTEWDSLWSRLMCFFFLEGRGRRRRRRRRGETESRKWHGCFSNALLSWRQYTTPSFLICGHQYASPDGWHLL